MKTFYCIILLTTLHFYTVGAKQAPHISGTVKINRSQGLIQCNFNLSHLPKLGKQYKLLLNRGLNIKFLKNDTGKVLRYNGFYDGKLYGEAVGYLPTLNNDTLALPQKLSISYTGSFPVYTDTLNSFDFKGLIAFNDKTVRAAEQSKWYPTIYDVKNDQVISDVTYDIAVECKDCSTIYLNGTKAQDGPLARFKSDMPRKLLLFAGDYAAQPLSYSTFLNPDLSNDEAKVFNQNITAITNFYKGYLQIPYGENITFLQHRAVEPYGPERSWGFVTFPTIAVAGKGFKSQINIQTGLLKDTADYRFYAHEMGHYYFGQLLQPNATLRWFFLEGMAEFLSVKATEAKYDKRATQQYISGRKKLMHDREVKPLPQVTSPDDIGQSYRYDYAPLILLAMEKRFGSKSVQLFCQQSLQHGGQSTNYTFFLRMVKAAGIRDQDWKLFEDQVINQTACRNIFSHF